MDGGAPHRSGNVELGFEVRFCFGYVDFVMSETIQVSVSGQLLGIYFCKSEVSGLRYGCRNHQHLQNSRYWNRCKAICRGENSNIEEREFHKRILRSRSPRDKRIQDSLDPGKCQGEAG